MSNKNSELEKRLIAPQREFKTLEEFKKGQNNFHMFFRDSGLSEIYQTKIPFLRYAEKYPKELHDVKESIKDIKITDPNFPLDKLYQAYNHMSYLVSINDPYVNRDGKIDNWYLCR